MVNSSKDHNSKTSAGRMQSAIPISADERESHETTDIFHFESTFRGVNALGNTRVDDDDDDADGDEDEYDHEYEYEDDEDGEFGDEAVYGGVGDNGSSSIPVQIYQYTQISSEDMEIRILCLRPGDWTAPLECDLYQVVEPTGGYEALSYAWGDSGTPQQLLINGRVLPIRQNLFKALRRLRERGQHQHPRVWVDAICINQANKQEKTDQLAIMGSIYANAIRTLVWLGEDFNDSSGTLCLDFAKGFDCSDNINTMSAQDVANLYSDFFQSRSLGPEDFNVGMMKRLSLRKWFTRRWVVQEVLNASEVKVLLGAEEATWDQMCVLFTRLRTLRRRYASTRRLDWIQPLTEEVISSQPDPEGDLLERLRVSDHLECEHPVDRIAALLGTGRRSAARSTFKIDYTESVEQNYVRFATHMVRAGHLSRLFRAATVRPQHSDLSALPSWSPDWRRHSHFESTYSTDAAAERMTSTSVSQLGIFEVGNRTFLRTTCLVYDRTDYFTRSFKYPKPGGSEEDERKWINEWINGWIEREGKEKKENEAQVGKIIRILVPTTDRPTYNPLICTFDGGATFFSFEKREGSLSALHPSDELVIYLIGELKEQDVEVVSFDSRSERAIRESWRQYYIPRTMANRYGRVQITEHDLRHKLRADDVFFRMEEREVIIA